MWNQPSTAKTAGTVKPIQKIRLASMLLLRVGLGSSPVMASGTSTSGKDSRWRSIQSLRISAASPNIAAINATVKAPQASIGSSQADQGTHASAGDPSQNQLTYPTSLTRSPSGM